MRPPIRERHTANRDNLATGRRWCAALRSRRVAFQERNFHQRRNPRLKSYGESSLLEDPAYPLGPLLVGFRVADEKVAHACPQTIPTGSRIHLVSASRSSHIRGSEFRPINLAPQGGHGGREDGGFGRRDHEHAPRSGGEVADSRKFRSRILTPQQRATAYTKSLRA